MTRGAGTSYSISVAGNSPKKEEKAKTQTLDNYEFEVKCYEAT